MEFKDYYKVLGVEPGADSQSIKTAYRKLARKYHPDVNSGKDSEEKFKEIAEAYEVLKDEEKRAEFDAFRRYGDQFKGGFEPPPGWKPGARADQFGGAQFNGDFSDFLSSLFGDSEGFGGFQQRSRGAHSGKGQDIEVQVPLFLEDIAQGISKTIDYSLPVQDQDHMVSTRKQLKVNIPKGVTHGERVRVKGKGIPSVAGGEAGDLLLRIRLVPHPVFDVEGHNLLVTLPLAPWEAALGTKVTVPTLNGNINLTVKPGTESGSKLRVKGKGLPKRKGGEGDLIAAVKIVVPPVSDEKCRQLWQSLATGSAFNPRKNWGG